MSRYYMPAEWEKHSATQLHWPSNIETWPGSRLQKVEDVFINIIEELHFYEPVHLFVSDARVKNNAMAKLSVRGIDLDRVIIHQQKVNDVWARDCGPIFVKDKQNERFIITDWEYNAWGEKYPPWDADNQIPTYVSNHFDIPRVQTEMVLEGGAIEVNGDGLLITTESVLLNENRNPDMEKREIEAKLKKYLGVKDILWLKGGLQGDDTDGHVDDITRFLNTDTVLTMITSDSSDVNYEILQENLERIQSYTFGDGRKLNIETLELPHTITDEPTVDGSEFVPASYANYYIANGVILVPLYHHENDSKAINLLEKYFPHRKVIGIYCEELVWGQGSIHCITQQWYL